MELLQRNDGCKFNPLCVHLYACTSLSYLLANSTLHAFPLQFSVLCGFPFCPLAISSYLANRGCSLATMAGWKTMLPLGVCAKCVCVYLGRIYAGFICPLLVLCLSLVSPLLFLHLCVCVCQGTVDAIVAAVEGSDKVSLVSLHSCRHALSTLYTEPIVGGDHPYLSYLSLSCFLCISCFSRSW